MKQIIEINQQIHRKYAGAIEKTASVLADHFNVNKFYWSKTYDCGKYWAFDSNLDLVERLTVDICRENPFYCHLKHHRGGAHMIDVANNVQFTDMNKVQSHLLKYEANLWIRLVRKTENSIEEFGFQSAQTDQNQALFLFNHLRDLGLLAKWFRDHNQRFSCALEEAPLNLREIVGPDFHQNRIQFSDPGYLARQKVLGELGVKIESNLSVAELETLKLLQKGYTASQIGTSLYRSRRTIEHRIERIKAKLSCASRRELIEKAEVLERSSSAFSVLY